MISSTTCKQKDQILYLKSIGGYMTHFNEVCYDYECGTDKDGNFIHFGFYLDYKGNRICAKDTSSILKPNHYFSGEGYEIDEPSLIYSRDNSQFLVPITI